MIWSQRTARVRTPATSANLGPGFDAMGLALALHDRVEAEVAPGGLTIDVIGEGTDTAGAGEDHLVVRAMRAAFARLGGQPPGLTLRCENAIPHGRGLGSSAAAIVSGLLAARALVPGGDARLPDEDVFALAVDLEGHPDNVAACLAGGLTLAWARTPAPAPHPAPGSPGAAPAGVRLARAPLREDLTAVVCVPSGAVATRTARGVLPAVVPHAEAAANAARSALLVLSLTSPASEPSLLFDATEDFLHQPYRAAVMPRTAALVARLRERGIAAVVSGAGPSVLALGFAPRQPDIGVVDSIARETGIGWLVIPLDVDRQGALVQPDGPEVPLPDSTRQGPPWNQVQGLEAGHAGGSP